MTTLEPPGDPDEDTGTGTGVQEQSAAEASSDHDDGAGLIARDESDAEQRAADAAREAKNHAFSAFYRGQFSKLITFLLYLGAPRREAEDLAQDTMRRAYLNWDTIEEPMGWVIRDGSRAFGHWKFRAREAPSESVMDNAPSEVSHGSDERLDKHDVLVFMKTLPYRQRQVMAYALLEYKPHEIAEIINIPCDAVRGSLCEARKKCRKWWKQRDKDQDEDSPGGEGPR